MTHTSIDAGGKLVTVHSISAFGVVGDAASSANPTGIHVNKNGLEVVSRQYYTADGRQIGRLQHGLNIIRETMVDGSERVTKVVAK